MKLRPLDLERMKLGRFGGAPSLPADRFDLERMKLPALESRDWGVALRGVAYALEKPARTGRNGRSRPGSASQSWET